jgi:hypothetical protein
LSKAWSGEHSLNSWNRGSNESNFVDIITSDSNCKDNNASILGSGDNRTKVGSVSVSFTISHEDHDLSNIYSSSVVLELSCSVLHTTGKASVSSGLSQGVDDVQEGLLRNGKSNDQSGSGCKHNQTHSNVLRSKGVSSCNISTKLLDLIERGGIDRSRLIKDKHEVNHLVALLVGASPVVVFSEDGCSRESSHIGKVNCLAIHVNSSTNQLVGVNVDGSYSIGWWALLGVSSATSSSWDCNSGNCGITSLTEVLWLRFIPC